MAGHSKWANIKHRKAAVDKKRGKIWSKISRAIIAAARQGGPDPATNLTLRYAIDEARYANMPKDTIKRAIDKGAGSQGGADFENVVFEGYGPGGVAIIVDALTDNNTRTVNEVRNIFNKLGGNMGQSGCVAFQFETRGQILIEGPKATEDALMEVAIEAGAEDVQSPDGDEGYWVVLADPTEFIGVRDAIEAASIEVSEAEITKIPQTMSDIDVEGGRKLLRLVDSLEDLDDVQKVYHNANIPEEALAE